MALQKDILFQGINLTYHKLIHIQEDYRQGKSIAVVASYLSKAARDADANDIFKTEQFEFIASDLIRAEVYNLLSQQVVFAGALDV